jgi:alpha-L-rhamnosidase
MTADPRTADSRTAVFPTGLTTELLERPLGIAASRPRMSWRLESGRRGSTQAARRIRVATESDRFDNDALVWDTGRHASADTLHVEYGGAPLKSRTRYHWRVDVWDDQDAHQRADSWFETALETADWAAVWIGRDLVNAPLLDAPSGDDDFTANTRFLSPPCLLRRSFESADKPVRARLYATARGLYQAHLNGHRIGDDELTPGWTEYHDRIMYQTYDVTDLVSPGANVLGAVLADGWWSGFVGFDPRSAARHYGREPEFLAQLVLEFADGTTQIVGTDDAWLERSGEILATDMLMGEYVDARRAVAGWSSTLGCDDGFVPVAVFGGDVSRLVSQSDQPVRVCLDVSAVSVSRLDDNRWVADLGQNMVGRVRLTVRGAKPGDRIRLRHAEMLDGAEPYLENLRRAEAMDVFTSAGDATEVFEPAFTLHGFRYVEVTGYPGDLSVGDVVGRVLANDVPWTGSFECSSELVNKLQSNIEWGQRGNFVAIPTDCPQRDERLGWLADAQIFMPTAARNADVSAFFARWLNDVRSGQTADGAFRDVAPVMTFRREAAPGWGDGGVLIPWFLYERYGDKRVLQDSFASMTAWVDYVHRHNPDLLWSRRTGNNYGDWLQVEAKTPHDVVATAYFARSAGVVARAAAVLDRKQEAETYDRLRSEIVAAFRAAYVDSDGRVAGDTQTSYLLALAFGLLPAELVPLAAGHLARNVEHRGNRLTTGFLGAGLLCPVLAEHGRSDLAFALLEQQAFPSWGYCINNGATTIWERWDGWTQDTGFQSPLMNSFNHYSLGAVGDWLYGGVAGIGQEDDSVAFEHVTFKPIVGGSLTWARASQLTARGLISCGWSREAHRLVIEVSVPPGVTASLQLPTATRDVTESGVEPAAAAGVSWYDPSRAVVGLQSGAYSFSAILE